jgi:hypothetical protein
MFPLSQKHEKARQIWAEAWASANRDVDLVGREGRRGGVVTCSSLFLCHIRLAGWWGGEERGRGHLQQPLPLSYQVSWWAGRGEEGSWSPGRQRWALTLASRSNARHRSKTRPSIERSERSYFFEKPKAKIVPSTAIVVNHDV